MNRVGIIINNVYGKIASLILIICHLSLVTASAAGRDSVTIVCDWDFAPYEYIDNKSKDNGFCIEVLNDILNDLNIPHKFVMGSRQQAVKAFFSHEADLIVDYSQRFLGAPYRRSLSILGYNYVSLARNRSSRPISQVDQINGQKIAVNVVNDSLPYEVIKRFEKRANLEIFTGREALGSLETGKLDYFLWGRAPLQWKIREYNMENVVIDSLDIPAIEIHIVGYDQKLIDDIDNQYARLQQSGKINLIREHWFHPDRAAKHTSPIVWYVVLAVLLLSLFVFFVFHFTRYRVHKAMQRNNVTEAMMHQALNMGNYSVIINNLRKNLLTNQHGHAVPDEGITMQQMMERIHPDDREATIMRRDVMRQLKSKPYPYRIRWNIGTKEAPVWHTITGFSYPEMGNQPVPKNIVIISRDDTEELRREQEVSEMTNRYIKMFESSLIAMSFYDKEGHLINLNENMKKLCGLNEENLKFFWTTNIFDTDAFREMDPLMTHNYHTCSHMYFPAIGIDKYVEQRVRPVFDDDGQLFLYAVTARDVTDERNIYLELQRQRKALDEASKANSRYERELRTLLENCNMYVWHVDVEKQLIAFSRTLHGEEFIMTLDDYVNNIERVSHEEIRRNYLDAIQSDKPFNVTRLLTHTLVSEEPEWFAISGMPLKDADGKVKTLFGVVRNVNDLMEAQQRLREETARAENSTILKSTFLANMTHEIRTPLNAIVGFSELLPMVNAPEERKEFISIIHNNCDMLMRLINDIFEASTLDVKPLAIVPHRVDFGKEFIVVCQSLEQRVQEPDVSFIADCPEKSFITLIDMGRIQQVITNFVTNAVKYTHNGHIKVGWRYQSAPNEAKDTQQGLYIYCEDTGAGIPKEKQARVFDRFIKLNDFVQGTGLGLAISKSIAQGCGGQIGLNSEGEGHGCTFWIWVPCKKLVSL